jgi:hypothetical protein
MQNSYCDHRNFDSVNQPLHFISFHKPSPRSFQMLRSRLFKAGLALTLGQNLIHRFCLGTSALLFISKLWKIELLLIQTGIVEKISSCFWEDCFEIFVNLGLSGSVVSFNRGSILKRLHETHILHSLLNERLHSSYAFFIRAYTHVKVEFA